MSKKEIAWYSTVFDEQSNRFVKTDKVTGKSWSWPYKERPSRKTHTVSSNGVTIDKLTAAGFKVRIRHLRYALYIPNDSFIGLYIGVREIVVPSTFRYSPHYKLQPKGGFTHITINMKDQDYICLSSECSKKDPFCYNVGIATALSRLTAGDLSRLGL
jgi:hypothetical protein